ncbi:MAG: hypothetical protein QXE05_00115 [Nitrososphaeria archaeon]
MENTNLEKMQSFSLIQSIFIPDSTLQGSEFPIHLMWDKNRSIRIDINVYSSLIKIKEVYNVDKKGLEIGENVVHLASFESNGYVGLVFISDIYKEALVEIPIKIEVRDTTTGEKQIIERKIIFFRPNVVLYGTPVEIKLIRKGDKIIINDKIYLKNEGKGTALVYFENFKESNVIIKNPEEIEEFVEIFCSRFSSKLNNVKNVYIQYSEIINDFEILILDLIKGTFKISEEYIQKMQNTIENLEKLFEEDEEFFKDIVDSFLSAYFSAINILTEIRGFLEYLKQLAENKVILLNAISMIELKPGLNFLKGHLHIHDLAKNVYEPIEIQTNLRVESEDPVVIPLFEIFKWSDMIHE